MNAETEVDRKPHISADIYSPNRSSLKIERLLDIASRAEFPVPYGCGGVCSFRPGSIVSGYEQMPRTRIFCASQPHRADMARRHMNIGSDGYSCAYSSFEWNRGNRGELG